MSFNHRNIFIAIILWTFSIGSTVAQNDTLKVLSWNVFLRPRIMSDGQMARVDSIAHYLNQSNADVLIVQEAFHRKARKLLTQLLSDTYAFHTKAGPKSFFGVPSGVVIYSKTPFKQKESHFSYRHATGSDRMAKKGIVKIATDFNGNEIAVIGTHLQAGRGEKRRNIRKKQVDLINSVKNTISDSTLLIYAGDFNISAASPQYDSLVEILHADNFQPTSQIKNTSNFSDHDLTSGRGKPNWIDFILLRRKKSIKFVSSLIESPRQFSEGKFKRLSDHNSIISTLVILEEE